MARRTNSPRKYMGVPLAVGPDRKWHVIDSSDGSQRILPSFRLLSEMKAFVRTVAASAQASSVG